MLQTDLSAFLQDGCGRCERYQTPACSVRQWLPVVERLLTLLRATPLDVAMKWGSPCFGVPGQNVVQLSATLDGATLGFFQGALLRDPPDWLVPPGPRSQAARVARFVSLAEVDAREPTLARLLSEAEALARSGAKVAFAEAPEPVPQELEQALADDPLLRQAFQALTPGRRRSHVIYVSGARQAGARQARVERCRPKILAGKGYLDR